MTLFSAIRSWFFIALLLGVLFSSLSMLEACSIMFWTSGFPPMEYLLRFLPPPATYGNLIQDLPYMVEMLYPNSSPLKENSLRTWIFITSRSIYRFTRDAIFGSLACAILLSFFFSRQGTPKYVILVWAILAVAYTMKAALLENDSD